MDNYCLTEESVETGSQALPFTNEQLPNPESVIVMKVKTGTHISNINRFAVKAMQPDSQRQIVYCGSGPACSKVISAVEVFKRQFSTSGGRSPDGSNKQNVSLSQLTRIRYRRLQDTWQPNSPELETLQVNRDIPSIHILLSKDPIDSTLPGYQDATSDHPTILQHPPSTGGGGGGKAKRKPRIRQGQRVGECSAATNKWKRPEKEKRDKNGERRKKNGTSNEKEME